MDSFSTSITVRPVWIGSLFGAKPITLNVQHNGIEVKQGDQCFIVKYEDVGEQVSLKKGTFYDDLSFGDRKDKLKSTWLTTNDAEKALRFTINYYYQFIADDIVKLRSNIKKQLLDRYPREKHWLRAKEECQLWVDRFKEVPSQNVVTSEQYEAFQYVERISVSDDAYFNKIKEEFVSSQLNNYKTYFDTVESNPLTEKQRIACTTDEENNLVIAGAGTGKTSVMIGRAGYLLESNQADPNDILMLAFGNKAAKEMSERLDEKLDRSDIKASTFHSLGQYIVAQVEQGKPSLSKLAESDKDLRIYVDECFQELMKEGGYRELAIEYFMEHLNEDINPFDYLHEGDYFQALEDNDIRTLKGEKVKSYQESVIANFLFRQGVEYQYEAKYEHNTRTLEFRQYQPDFYLPDYGIYIEHYGIDEKNNTAPYVDNEKYLESIEWKRCLHAANNTPCFETYHYEHKNGQLLRNLKDKLMYKGVELNPMPDEAIIETLKEQGNLTEFTQLLAGMLRLFKAANHDEGGLYNISANAKNPAKFVAAVKLLMPIVHKYEQYLVEHNDIDFDDMINKAIAYVKDGRFLPHWKYIMVDEFQDISGPRADLIIALRNRVNDCSLFCVGDDWQAIYRFAGSDLSYTTEFQKIFGTTETTNLDITFRFNNSINDVAARFVQVNPEQLNKSISTISIVEKPAVSLMRSDNQHEEDQLNNIKKVFKSICEKEEEGARVLILGRYNFNLPKKNVINNLKVEFSNLDITAMTIHASKGKEADYVILLNLESGKYGFPSEKITHPLLDALLPPQQEYPFAEERRLFYVALTRAKTRVYLITDMAMPSLFLTELLNNHYPIELNEFSVSDNQLLFQKVNCIKCESGVMMARTGQYGDYFGCSHYPRCKHAEAGCDCCGSLMKREGRYKICTNLGCDGWAPICPVCNAEMVRKNGRYGEFWGCKNYRSQGVSCEHTEKTIEPPNMTMH